MKYLLMGWFFLRRYPVIPIFILITFPFLEKLLIFWLQDQYSKKILELTKIFLIVSWISGISHILITFFEGKKK